MGVAWNQCNVNIYSLLASNKLLVHIYNVYTYMYTEQGHIHVYSTKAGGTCIIIMLSGPLSRPEVHARG